MQESKIAIWCIQRPKNVVFNFYQNLSLALLFGDFQKNTAECRIECRIDSNKKVLKKQIKPLNQKKEFFYY